MKMFMHGELKQDDPNLQDGDLSVYIRLGSDFTRNYYEVEMPLVLSREDATINDPGYDRIVWREENDFDLLFQQLKDLKIERNNENFPFGSIYPLEGKIDINRPDARLRIKGNPNLGDVKGVMIGVRNSKDDGVPHCAEIWVNELRVYGIDERGGGAALARVDMQLADFGNVTLSGAYSSIGFGALDQQVLERSREEIVQLDVATNLELGKFFPSKWGIKVPFYAQYSTVVNTPQFDPYDLDLTLKEKLDGITDAAVDKDSIRELAKDVTTIQSINFTNVRKDRNPEKAKVPLPWDIENFSFTYAQSTTTHRDPIIENDEVNRRQGAVDYAYQVKPVYITPLKFVNPKNKKYLKFISEFNFNPVPSNFTFSTLMDRQIAETTYRFAGDPQFSTFYNKRWTWDRNYNLQWDLAKNLKFNFSALNQAVIDEPEGLIDTDAKRELVWNNIRDFGRNKNYSHNFSVNFTLPFKQIPLLDWINSRATYNASYSWNAAALEYLELG